MAVYDAVKTRQAAHLMKQLVDSVGTDVNPCIRNASEQVEALRGRTARMMEEQLAQLAHRAVVLQDELEALAYQINTYADALEVADKQLAEKL